MFTKGLIAAAALSFGFLTPVHAEGVKLCHIANAGFLAEGKDVAVLFDAARITDEYDGSYTLPTKGLMADLTAGTGAFSKVKLALVSHRHNDHFDAGATLAHLRGDSDVEYIMPPEALELLQTAGLTDAERKRVHALLPPWEGGPVTKTIAGVKVEAYRVDHGPNRPQNNGYRVIIDGKSFFHTGDISATEGSLRKAGLNRTPVDVMLLAYWYGLDSPAQNKAIFGAWEIGTVVPMHYGAAETDWMKRNGGKDLVIRYVQGQWPGSVQLTGEMDCHTFD
jgi:L-ascorbate metabolism protein UlaG (beta-lactamase superfamily)